MSSTPTPPAPAKVPDPTTVNPETLAILINTMIDYIEYQEKRIGELETTATARLLDWRDCTIALTLGIIFWFINQLIFLDFTALLVGILAYKVLKPRLLKVWRRVRGTP